MRNADVTGGSRELYIFSRRAGQLVAVHCSREGDKQLGRGRLDSNTCHAGPPTRVSAPLCRNPRTMERVNIELRFPADDPALTATVRHDAQR